MAGSEALGSAHEVTLPAGRIHYRERGAGPPVVFVHGLLVNADLWRAVVPAVAEGGLRCIAPDWPMGSHATAVPDADLSPPGLAALIASFLERLELHDVTVVANDTGGAITQILMTRHPERIGRVVLTSSDCFDRFFPPPFAFLPAVARLPGSLWALGQVTRIRALHRLPFTFGWVTKRPIPPAVVDSYLLPPVPDRAGPPPGRAAPAGDAGARRRLVHLHPRGSAPGAQSPHRGLRPHRQQGKVGGAMPAVELSAGTVEYEDTGGDAPVVVLLHGRAGRPTPTHPETTS